MKQAINCSISTEGSYGSSMAYTDGDVAEALMLLCDHLSSTRERLHEPECGDHMGGVQVLTHPDAFHDTPEYVWVKGFPR